MIAKKMKKCRDKVLMSAFGFLYVCVVCDCSVREMRSDGGEQNSDCCSCESKAVALVAGICA